MKNQNLKNLLTLGLILGISLLFVGWVAQAAEKAAAPAGKPAVGPPETMTLGSIKNLYEAVEFTHKAHLGYAGNCAECHHHSPAGETPKCSDCHSAAKIADDTSATPGLKGAYHRQCMDCHKKMGSGPMGCTDCHAKRKVETKDSKPAN